MDGQFKNNRIQFENGKFQVIQCSRCQTRRVQEFNCDVRREVNHHRGIEGFGDCG